MTAAVLVHSTFLNQNTKAEACDFLIKFCENLITYFIYFLLFIFLSCSAFLKLNNFNNRQMKFAKQV